jgi:Trypsin
MVRTTPRLVALAMSFAVATTTGYTVPGNIEVGLVNGTVDEDDRFSNVGALVVQFLDGNPFGMPPGTTVGACTGTLIHPKVWLSAGHCLAPGVFGVPPGVRVAITFSPDDVFDESQWIEVNPAPGTQVVHPSFPLPCFPPPGECSINHTDGLPEPGISDIGLIFLDHPAHGIKPAKLGNGDLDGPVQGVRMTVVGYGSTQGPTSENPFSGIRRYGSSTVKEVIDSQWVTFNLDPVGICAGDSGGPTFFNDRVVAVVSDGNEDCTSADVRARVDSVEVRGWIKSAIEARLGDSEPIAERHIRSSDGSGNESVAARGVHGAATSQQYLDLLRTASARRGLRR